MLREAKKKILESVNDKLPSRLSRGTSEATCDSFLYHAYTDYGTDDDGHHHQCNNHHSHHHHQCDTLPPNLGGNASIPYTTLQTSGPASRPLEFPAPTVDRATTLSADVIDHRSGNIFRATSVLMRRPLHAKACAARATSGTNSPTSDATGNNPALSPNYIGHNRTNSRDSIHSWHSAFNAPSPPLSSLSSAQLQQQAHRRTQSNPMNNAENLPPCGPACDLPDRAYCVRRKLCETTDGSIRLCVVMKRVSRNIAGRVVPSEESAFDSLPRSVAPERNHNGNHWRGKGQEYAGGGEKGEGRVEVPGWETTDQMVAIKVRENKKGTIMDFKQILNENYRFL